MILYIQILVAINPTYKSHPPPLFSLSHIDGPTSPRQRSNWDTLCGWSNPIPVTAFEDVAITAFEDVPITAYKPIPFKPLRRGHDQVPALYPRTRCESLPGRAKDRGAVSLPRPRSSGAAGGGGCGSAPDPRTRARLLLLLLPAELLAAVSQSKKTWR